ncbi:MAG: pilus assembly protein PilM [Candidatus Omnitrophica bacterium]|nr:pilus assembly protein PilM [Candidatus Omnitrophota bacterium]
MKISGIYITNKSIRFVQSVKAKKGQAILKEERMEIPSAQENDLGNIIKSYLRGKNITTDYLVLGIPRTQVSIKSLNLPTINDNEIRNMVEFELNNLFPYKAEELTYDHAVIHKGTDNYSRIILVAAPKEDIAKQVSLLRKAGLTPDSINISTISLLNQFLEEKREPLNYLLINLDDGFMEMVFISAGKLELSRGIGLSIRQGREDILKEIESTVTILEDKAYKIDKIILSAKAQDLQGLAKSLEQALPYQVEIDNTFDVLKGFALHKNGKTLKINLLPEEFKIQKAKNERRRSLLIFAALLLLNLSLIANIFYFGVKAKRGYLSLLRTELQNIYPEATLLQNKMLNLQVAKNYINSGRLTLGLLSELYSASPEGIKLSSLDITSQKSPGNIAIEGQAKNSEIVYRFADALRGSPLIKKADVSFVSKVNPQASEQSVNFEIKAIF